MRARLQKPLVHRKEPNIFVNILRLKNESSVSSSWERFLKGQGEC